jgi:hypothetical protein
MRKLNRISDNDDSLDFYLLQRLEQLEFSRVKQEQEEEMVIEKFIESAMDEDKKEHESTFDMMCFEHHDEMDPLIKKIILSNDLNEIKHFADKLKELFVSVAESIAISR